MEGNFLKQKGEMKKIPKTGQYFKEEMLCDEFCISSNKPCIKRILRVLSDIEITGMKLISTDMGKSIEGVRASRYRLEVEFKCIHKMTYVAMIPMQCIYVEQYEKMYTQSIVLPDRIEDKPVQQLYRSGQLRVNAYIEGNCFRRLELTKFYLGVLALIEVR